MEPSYTQILNSVDLINKNSNTAFFIYNLEINQLEFVNGAFEKLVSKSFEELQADISSGLEIVNAEDREYVIKSITSGQNNNERKNIEFRVMMEGEEHWLCLNTIPFYDEQNSNLIVGSITDITKGKEQKFMLDKYNSKKNATLNILSHDLASPSNNIQQLSDLIKNRTRKYNDPEVDKLLNYISETSKKGSDLIQDFIAHEFLESSTTDVIKRRLNIAQKVKLIEEDYKNSQELLNKRFNFYYSSDEIFVEMDDMKFMQVLNNIYLNAIKFTGDGAVINTRVEEKENSVLISIEDNGIGIPKHLQPMIFEKFTKARRKGLKGEKTTGLGLSLAKMIVEWHNGKIWFTSEENKGTTFFVEIPKEG
jgi:two-component system, OmpR family, sensor histidine kinase VicK